MSPGIQRKYSSGIIKNTQAEQRTNPEIKELEIFLDKVDTSKLKKIDIILSREQLK